MERFLMRFPNSKLKFTVLFITIAITIGTSTATGNPLSDCLSLSRELNLGEELCEGKTPIEFNAKIKAINVDKVRSLQTFGVTLRRLGYLQESESALQQALLKSPEDEAIALSLANLQQQQYRRAISFYKATDDPATRSAQTREAIAKAGAALAQYEAITKNRSTSSKILADVNWIDLWSSLAQDIPELKELQQQNLSVAKTITESFQFERPELDLVQKTEAQINLAESLLKAIDLDSSFASLSQANADAVLKTAEASGDMRIASRAYGVRGLLLKRSGRNVEAIAELGKAASSAQSIRAADLAYQWNWELGKLNETEGHRDKALEYYGASVDSLTALRKEMTQLNPEIQYELRDKVEPIYREYMSLLLNSEKPDLKKTISVNESLQTAEVEIYLQCNLLKTTSLLDLSDPNSPDAAVYIIRLPKRYAVIVRSKDGALKHRLIEAKIVEADLELLRRNIHSDLFNNLTEQKYRKLFGNVYQSLFLPINDLLPKEGTLVLELDRELQSIPWGMLYDGQHYLIERYSLAYSLGSELRNQQQTKKSRLRALVGGLSEKTNDSFFGALPSVLNEVKGIKTLIQSETLLNKNFTASALLAKSKGYPIIHLASHGQFSSDPQETFILGWNERITLSKLSNLVQNQETNPLELLVLSACTTAVGDNRATLGIAGTAVQSGARSTVATLWLVNDNSQALLMEAFYKALKDGKSKADALRIAQLSLLRGKSQQYRSPYFWGSAILIGSPS
jgi:CHAT domain-containing protein